jgi:hypothetical protein
VLGRGRERAATAATPAARATIPAVPRSLLKAEPMRTADREPADFGVLEVQP